MKHFYYIAIVFIILISGCKSIEKNINAGNYDYAIDIAVKKLQGGKKDEEVMKGLELAYQKATEKDKMRINQLKSSENAAFWPEIYMTYSNMDIRQNKIIPLLPLITKSGEVLKFETMNLFAVKEEARTNAAEYYYNEGKRLLSVGKKTEARSAFMLFQNIKDYFAYYKDTEDLINEAYAKGINKVFVLADKKNGILLPPNYEEDLVAMDFQSKAPDWVVFFYDNAQFKTFDYIVRIYFAEIQITPETVKETHYDESKEIQDGFEYLKDPKGDVMKDSLGNDIKIPKNVIISAHITESQQNKASKVMGEVEIRDGFSNKLVDKVAVSGGAIFSNFFAAYTGNKAALKPETLAKIGNRPVNFPTDMQMVDKSKEEMKNSIYRAIYDRMEIFTK
jgi:hypothetical protein